eukprot:gene8466-10852_t
MAGRAGGRGKGVEGTVVLMRSKVKGMSLRHDILTSPVDDIRSHVTISYGLLVRLWETRSVAECRLLVKRGFGATYFGSSAQYVTQAADEEDNDLWLALVLHTGGSGVVSAQVEDMYKAKCKASIDCLPTRPVQLPN